MRKQKSKKILLKMARHIAYEIQMLHHAYILYSKPKINKNHLLRSAFIEVFLLHGRILYHFFYRQKPHKKRCKEPEKDDVIVEDFLSNKSFKSFKRERANKEEIDKIFPMKRVNKELAHLSYYRLKKTPKTKQWDINNIYNKISKTVNAFLKNVNLNIKNEMLKYKWLKLFNY